ncbi:MAG: hypothetical protein J7L34_08645 [Thermotogaceae bacterium]|nr:hypothetical protein [Thermotogaceae bacterium]
MRIEWIKTHHQALAPFNRFKEKPLVGIGPGAGGHVMNYETFHTPGVSRYITGPCKVDVFSMSKDAFCGVRAVSKVLKGRAKISAENFTTSLQIALDERWVELKGKNIMLLPKGVFWTNTLVYLMSLDFLHIYSSLLDEARR